METKELLKSEIDNMPNDMIEQMYKFAHSLKAKKSMPKKIHSFKLKGQFDDINVREYSNE